MSEMINNREYRQKLLKEIILELHGGRGVDEVKQRFEGLIKGISTAEIAEMEQGLMMDGMPPEEIQNLCDVHAAVFKGSIEEIHRPRKPEETPGHPVHTFKAENRELEKLVNEGIRPLIEGMKAAPGRGSAGEPRGDPADGPNGGPDGSLEGFDGRQGGTAGRLEGIAERLKEDFSRLREVGRHYSRKENLLFPYLEKYGVTAPPKVMWGVDDEIRAAIRDVMDDLEGIVAGGKGADRQGLAEKAGRAADRIIEMVFKEENILFPMALDILSEDEWTRIAESSDEIGYCLIEPMAKWTPARTDLVGKAGGGEVLQNGYVKELQAGGGEVLQNGYVKELQAGGGEVSRYGGGKELHPGQGEMLQPRSSGQDTSGDGYVKFDAGTLTAEEINAIFNTLPADVTFVDRDGAVKYFSQGKDRIFARPKTVIGRQVQNCHPPASVHIVEKIVDDLKSGIKDHEDFWIRMGNKYVYIRYFAVRDEKGGYLGVLEYTQDIGPIQEISGEKRLMSGKGERD